MKEEFVEVSQEELMTMRRNFLALNDVLERLLGISPRTSELRKVYKEQQAKTLDRHVSHML